MVVKLTSMDTEVAFVRVTVKGNALVVGIADHRAGSIQGDDGLLVPRELCVATPRSVMMPPAQRKACRSPAAGYAQPATFPASSMSRAELFRPPRVPRSVSLPLSQGNACEPMVAGSGFDEEPTTWCLSLIAVAALEP